MAPARGVLPVAVLTTLDFDAADIDHETVVFGPGEAHEAHANRHGVKRHEQDVDGDGDVDLLFHFRLPEAALDCGAAEATLRGRTYDGGRAAAGTYFCRFRTEESSGVQRLVLLT